MITHRGRPVARIEPCLVDGPDDEHAMAELLRRGVAVPPRAPLDVERFLGAPVARLATIVSRQRRAARASGFREPTETGQRHSHPPMPTDLIECGLERLICEALTGDPCDARSL